MAAGALVPCVESEIEEYEEGEKIAVEKKINLGNRKEVDKRIQMFEKGVSMFGNAKNEHSPKPHTHEAYALYVFLEYIQKYRKGLAEIIGDEAFLKKHRVVRKSK